MTKESKDNAKSDSRDRTQNDEKTNYSIRRGVEMLNSTTNLHPPQGIFGQMPGPDRRSLTCLMKEVESRVFLNQACRAPKQAGRWLPPKC